jgi:hypothetical protein
VVSHISRKTSEIWGTPRFLEGKEKHPGTTQIQEFARLKSTPYGSKPNTATLFVVPTYTLPLAIIGGTNLLSEK